MLVEGVGCWGKGWYLPHTAPVEDQWQQLRSFKSGCRFDEKGNLDIEDSNHIFHVAHSTDSQLARKWEKWERSEIPADPPPVLDPSLQAIQQTVFLDDWLFDDQINVPGIWHFLPGNIRRVSYPFGTHDYSLSDLATIHYQVINEAPGRVLLRTWSREPTDDSQGGFQSDRLFSCISLELDPQDLKVGERYFYNSSGHKIRYRYCNYVEKDFPYPFGADPKQQFVEIFRRIGDGGTICNISTAGIIGKEYEWVFHPGGERSPIGIPMDMP